MMMSPAFEENRIHPDLGPLIVKQPLTPSSCGSFGLLSRAKLSLTQAVNLRFKRAELSRVVSAHQPAPSKGREVTSARIDRPRGPVISRGCERLTSVSRR